MGQAGPGRGFPRLAHRREGEGSVPNDHRTELSCVRDRERGWDGAEVRAEGRPGPPSGRLPGVRGQGGVHALQGRLWHWPV